MDPEDSLAHLRRDGPRLSAAARRVPTAAVPSCPDWTMSELVGHTGSVHRWVTGLLRTRVASGEESRQFYERPPEGEDVADWYDAGLSDLVGQLSAVDPSDKVWNWSDNRPEPARFWFRRMALETVVHRWDAENAAGDPGPIDPALAEDGIDEFISFVPDQLAVTPQPLLNGVLALAASDRPVASTLTLTPDHIECAPGIKGADVVVRATTSDLYLWMINRLPFDAACITVEGDPAIARAWSSVKFE